MPVGYSRFGNATLKVMEPRAVVETVCKVGGIIADLAAALICRPWCAEIARNKKGRPGLPFLLFAPEVVTQAS